MIKSGCNRFFYVRTKETAEHPKTAVTMLNPEFREMTPALYRSTPSVGSKAYCIMTPQTLALKGLFGIFDVYRLQVLKARLWVLNKPELLQTYVIIKTQCKNIEKITSTLRTGGPTVSQLMLVSGNVS